MSDPLSKAIVRGKYWKRARGKVLHNMMREFSDLSVEERRGKLAELDAKGVSPSQLENFTRKYKERER